MADKKQKRPVEARRIKCWRFALRGDLAENFQICWFGYSIGAVLSRRVDRDERLASWQEKHGNRPARR